MLPQSRQTEGSVRRRFLDRYESGVAKRTRLFDGMDAVLDGLERHGVPWGIVTNKISRFTLPLVTALGLIEDEAPPSQVKP